MFYALFMIVSAAFAAVWAFAWSLGGLTARRVITGGLYRPRPRHAPHRARRNRSQRGHADHRARMVTIASLTDLLPAEPAAPETTEPASLVVHAELDAEHTGAENWDTLLTDMTTEEREIYNLEMYETHEQLMDVQRGIYQTSDNRFAQLMDRWNAGTEAVTCGARGWDTGMWQTYDATAPRIPEELLV